RRCSRLPRNCGSSTRRSSATRSRSCAGNCWPSRPAELFTPEERERVRARLLELAEADPDVVGTAITGSHVSGAEDEWSDVDLAFAIGGEMAAALERWRERLYRDFGALHHWDLPWGSS